MSLKSILNNLRTADDPTVTKLDAMMERTEFSRPILAHIRLRAMPKPNKVGLQQTLDSLEFISSTIGSMHPFEVITASFAYKEFVAPETVIPLLMGISELDSLYRSVRSDFWNPYHSGFGLAGRYLLGQNLRSPYIFNELGHAISLGEAGTPSEVLTATSNLLVRPKKVMRGNAPQIALHLIGFGDALILGYYGLPGEDNFEYLRIGMEAYDLTGFDRSVYVRELVSTLSQDRVGNR
jgi:hypothetical protein